MEIIYTALSVPTLLLTLLFPNQQQCRQYMGDKNIEFIQTHKEAAVNPVSPDGNTVILSGAIVVTQCKDGVYTAYLL